MKNWVLREHVRKKEERMFPAARNLLDGRRADELGRQIEELKGQSEPGRPARNNPARPTQATGKRRKLIQIIQRLHSRDQSFTHQNGSATDVELSRVVHQ